MAKISIWKRVGGWLRRTTGPANPQNVVRLDAEGLLVDEETEPIEAHVTQKEPENTSIFARSHKKEHQITAMEEGFNRLVEVLESINENVISQRQLSVELHNRLESLPTLTSVLPEVVETQKTLVTEMTTELRNQAQRHQQVAELLGRLPNLSEVQVGKLEYIIRQLESSAQTETRMSESYQRMDHTLREVAASNKDQLSCLSNVAELLGKNEQVIRQQLTRQNRRFMWLILVVVLGGLALAGAAAVIVWQLWFAQSPVSPS